MKKRFKAFLSFFLTAAVLVGTIPAYNLNVMAAEAGPNASYTQALDKTTTIKGVAAEDSAALAVVNKSGEAWEHSPKGKALSVTANNGEARVHLLGFGDGVEAVELSQAVLTDSVSGSNGGLPEAVSSGNGILTEAVVSGNPGLSDVIYEISMRTGDKLYGNVGFLARYKDENHYAGMTIDFSKGTYSWVCQYSTAANPPRANVNFPNSGDMSSLKTNTDYLIELTCQGMDISCRVMEQGSSEYINLGSLTQSQGSYYTGPGGLAIRLNPGSGDPIVGGKDVVIDNIVQKTIEGQVVRTMDFDDGNVPEYKVYANKGTQENSSLASLAIVDIPELPATEPAEGFGVETVNKLTSVSGGLFVDEASPEVDNGIYTVKTNGTVNNYGLVFNYKDAENYAALRFDGTKWTVEGKNAGKPVSGIVLAEQPQALTAGTAHTLVLDYSDLTNVTLKVDDNDAAAIGNLGNAVPESGRVGLVLGEAGTLYTGAIQLAYTAGESDAYDPGLPEVILTEGQDSYTQPFVGNMSTLANNGVAASALTANQPPFGFDDKALSLKGADENRVKFTEFNDGPADGSYEFAFRTGADAGYQSVGFLARYVDESKYVGLSIDKGAWTLHAATGLGSRQNTAFPNQYGALSANTTYKVRMEFVGKQVSLKAMKEGDSDYFDLGTLTTSGHTAGGAFAVRLRTGNADLFMDNIVQYDAGGNVVKSLDFNDGAIPEFEVRSNKSNTLLDKSQVTMEIKEGYPTGETVPGITPGSVSKIEATQRGVYIDSASPVGTMGSMTVQLKGTASQYGIVFNYKDEDNYATIEYDGTKWIAGGKNEGKDVALDLSEHNIPVIKANDTRTFRITKSADGYTLLISGGPETTKYDYTKYDLGTLDGIYSGDGKSGVVVGEPMTLFAGPVSLVFTLKAVQMPVPTENVITIKSDRMQAVVGDAFPHIYAYLDQDGGYLTGTGLLQGEEKTGMNILTGTGMQNCTTVSELKGQTEDSATYEITAKGSGLEAVFTVVLKVVDNTLELNVTDVNQITGTVRTFAFEDLQMVAILGRGAGAALGFINNWGPASDLFIDLKSSSRDTTYNKMTYALFYDKISGVVAAVENNAEQGTDKYLVKQNAAYPYLSASNTAWAWKYYDNTDVAKNKPYAKVVIGGDENKDGDITWQDAGIAYRDIMIKAYGSENTKNEWMYIAMNMSSGASQPFLRVLDEAKSISYLTDGFGMKIMNKGYQGGGHDDSHGDYDFVGTQQGGVDDFNTLINEGLKYGIKNGVHINASEFALDGMGITKETWAKSSDGELKGAWGWFDKAFGVDKSQDVKSGELERRLDDFEDKVPNLDFIYVDVYQSGSNFNSTEFMRYMNENGTSVGTEALGDFNQQINFVHWNTDLNYSTGGTQSEVLKFVIHGKGDLTAPDRALLGSIMPGVADWRNANEFNEGERAFYRNNLPTKYLQYFDLLSWTPDEGAVLSDNVRTEVKEEGGRTYTSIYKDSNLIAKIDTTAVKTYDAAAGYPALPGSSEIFIPWSPVVEDKIYCYNDKTTTKTWDLPDSWKGVTEAYLYPLTENGRDSENVKVVPVTNNQVSLTLDLSSPYILVKQAAEQAHRYNADGTVMVENGQTVMLPTTADSEWGYGSRIKNFGFSGKTFEGWTKEATAGNKEDIVIDTTITTPKGNPRVAFPESVAGSISQVVTVEPGKTYSFSAWTMAEGKRSPKLTVQAGDVSKEASVETTAGIPIKIKPSKYTGKDYQRLKVDITIPAGITQVTLTFSAESGSNPVYVDDFRCWEWLTAPNPKEAEYYYFEDFENVDENWGPFISQVGNQPFIHLSYKDPDGKQIKYYTLDTYDENGNLDKTNLTSLKGRQKDNYGPNGLLMRTLPSTLDFKQGSKYLVEIDHATYLEDLNTLNGHHVGYNYALDQALYYMEVRSANGTILGTYPLEPSSFTEEGINARPSTEVLSFVVDATEESGIYLTMRRDLTIYTHDPVNPKEPDSRPAFVLDNVRVTQIDDTEQYNVTFETTPSDAEVIVQDAKGGIIEAQDGKYVLTPGVYTYIISAEGYAVKTAAFTVTKDTDIKVVLEEAEDVTFDVVFMTSPENATVVVKDSKGNVVQPAEGKNYKLHGGRYDYAVTAEGYLTTENSFIVEKEMTIPIALERDPEIPEMYQIIFQTIPENATVTVKDEEGNVIEPVEGKTYNLPRARYNFTVAAEGYITKELSFTAARDFTIPITLERDPEKPVTYEVKFITTPDNAAVVVKDAENKVVEAAEGKTYKLEAGKYSYTVSAEGYVTKTAEITVAGADAIEVTLEKEVVEPETYEVKFTTTPENATVVVKDAENKVVEAAEGKAYKLEAGKYSYTVSAEGYVTKTAEITVTGADTIAVILEKEVVEPETYEVKFATTPDNAAVVVKDAQGNVVAPAEGKTYVLEAGASYSYTVSAEGYVTKSAGFTAGESADITVELVKEDVKPVTYKVTFTTTPENAAVVVKDAQGKEVAPAEGKTYTLEAGSYNYTVSAEGYVTKMAAVLVKGDETVSVELEKTTTPAPDPTPGDDGSDDGSDTGSGDQNSGSSDDAGQNNEVKAPKTGDIAPFGIIAAMIGLGVVGIAGVTFARRRKK